jgi:phosphatidylglycerophosphatase A
MSRLALVLATAGGVGYAPVASGTFGSLVVLPLLPPLAALRDRHLPAALVVVAASVAVAVWAAGRAETILGGHDHGAIVIDEVAGMLLAGLCVPATWTAAALAFFVFRAFDVWKPFPANVFDQRVAGGVGVVGDDLFAGLYAGIVTRLVLELL